MLLKPAANRSVLLFTAPFLWTAIGLMLIYRGYGFLPDHGRLYAMVLAVVVGTAKSLLILDRSAQKSVKRIVNLQDGTCLGAVYSWRTWGMILCMICLGVTVRRLVPHGILIGSLYCAIGWGLCFSSRLGWRAWRGYDKRE
ncbi:MAG: hypothetical protein CSA33_02950 [Desulfobulbus propionicus]|nr:MAG: hypothetical protein CSA33_02950 [Desulfobulbus propionicus]